MSEQGQPGRRGTFRYTGETSPLRCSFCGKEQAKVAKLIAGPGVYICNECITLCFVILQEEFEPSGTFRLGVRRADGTTEKIEVDRVPFSTGDRSGLQQCKHCGTWLAGEGITECLHCGAATG